MSSALVANLIVQVGRRVRRGTELEDAMRHTVAQYWQSIDPDTVRAADFTAIALERIGGAIPERGYVIGLVPDLVVEVVSPGNSAPAAERRAQMWLDAGVRLVLTALIDAREIVTNHDNGAVRQFGIDDTLTLDPVLPGFACPVADIFTY